jgi:hypothetical protein
MKAIKVTYLWRSITSMAAEAAAYLCQILSVMEFSFFGRTFKATMPPFSGSNDIGLDVVLMGCTAAVYVLEFR